MSEICGCTYVAWHLSAYQPGDVTTVKEAQAAQSALRTDFYAFSCLAAASVVLYVVVLIYFVSDGMGYCKVFNRKNNVKTESENNQTQGLKRASSRKFHIKNLKAPFDDGEIHQFQAAELTRIRGGKKTVIGIDRKEKVLDVDKRIVDKNNDVISVGDVVMSLSNTREGLVVKTYMRDSIPYADVTLLSEVARKYEANDTLRGRKLNPITLMTEKEGIQNTFSNPNIENLDQSVFQNENPLFIRQAAPSALQLAASKDQIEALLANKRIEIESCTREVDSLEKELQRAVIEESHHEVSDDDSNDDDAYDEIFERRQDGEENESRDRTRSSFQPEPRAWSGWALTGGLF